MASRITLLCLHGLGDHRNSTWQADWERVPRDVVPGQDQLELQTEFLTYDPIFEDVEISAWEAAQALWKLTRSGVGSLTGRHRGAVSGVSDRIRWSAGYVVAWLEDEAFRSRTRALLLEAIAQHRPDALLAHSLGSLIAYDALSHRDARRPALARALARMQFVSLGSQIGNPFVTANLTPGRIAPLPVQRWTHLYNHEDDVFTAPVRLWEAENFEQVDTPFDIDGFADHDAVEYLQHRNAVASLWRPMAERALNSRRFGARPAARRRNVRAASRPSHRALLIGINAYPRSADRLEGCVNDVFLMSSVLQECAFAPGTIRTLLDERATCEAIHERLEWLFDDPRSGDERVLYYSGHGARIPQYGEDFEPDRHVETLVPVDFDWSPRTAVADDHIYSLYSQLPYDTRVAMIFDCCHSGGMHREGGARARGIDPPDDVRHRALRWDADERMWVARDYRSMNPSFGGDAQTNAAFFGNNRATARLGRASVVRAQSESQYRAAKRRSSGKPVGPYLPLIIEACGEEQLSYEYRHGVTSYGAFTYALASRLRHYRRITFSRLVSETGEQLARLGYAQTPQILGPRAVCDALVPWLRN